MIELIDLAGLVGNMIYISADKVVLINDPFKPVVIGIHYIQYFTERTAAIILQQGIYIAMYVITVKTTLVIPCCIISQGKGSIGHPVAKIFLHQWCWRNRESRVSQIIYCLSDLRFVHCRCIEPVIQ